MWMPGLERQRHVPPVQKVERSGTLCVCLPSNVVPGPALGLRWGVRVELELGVELGLGLGLSLGSGRWALGCQNQRESIAAKYPSSLGLNSTLFCIHKSFLFGPCFLFLFYFIFFSCIFLLFFLHALVNPQRFAHSLRRLFFQLQYI